MLCRGFPDPCIYILSDWFCCIFSNDFHWQMLNLKSSVAFDSCETTWLSWRDTEVLAALEIRLPVCESILPVEVKTLKVTWSIVHIFVMGRSPNRWCCLYGYIGEHTARTTTQQGYTCCTGPLVQLAIDRSDSIPWWSILPIILNQWYITKWVYLVFAGKYGEFIRE